MTRSVRRSLSDSRCGCFYPMCDRVLRCLTTCPVIRCINLPEKGSQRASEGCMCHELEPGRGAGVLSDYNADCAAEESRFDSRQDQRTFPFLKASRRALGQIHFRIQWVKGKGFPLCAWNGSWGSTSLRLLDFLDFRHYEGVRSSPLRTDRLYPQEFSWYHF
jgi:hypothetical protein